MEFSLGKTFWNIWLKFFDVSIKFFFVLDLAIFVLIMLQIKPDFKELEAPFIALSLIFTIVGFMQILPLWIKVIYVWIYFKFSHLLILRLLALGMIDYNFIWTSPKWISDIISVFVKHQFADFVFWSGLVLAALLLIDHLERRSLVFLAQKMNIGWARELIEERLEKMSKARKAEQGTIEVNRGEEVKDNEIPLPSFPKEIKERIVFKPQFFKDRLWYQMIMFLSFVFPILMLPFLAGGISGVSGMVTPSNPLFWVFGGTFLLVFLICLPFYIWEATTMIVLEKNKIVIRTFFFKKIEIPYMDIKNIDVQTNQGMKIYYEKQTKGKRMLKVARLFPWAFTTEKLLEELKPRLDNVDINDDFIIKAIKTVKAARGLVTVLTVLITVGLLTGFIYYIIHQAINRPKFSEKDCASRLEFWINDEPKTGILETKEGFSPELSIGAPFYFFVNAEKNAPECDKKLSLAIYDAKGNVVFQRGSLIPPKTGIGNYYWESILKEKGDYLLKINYGNIPAKKINFSVR